MSLLGLKYVIRKVLTGRRVFMISQAQNCYLVRPGIFLKSFCRYLNPRESPSRTAFSRRGSITLHENRISKWIAILDFQDVRIKYVQHRPAETLFKSKLQNVCLVSGNKYMYTSMLEF